jgi:lipopolysaccharide/colanic/teichoic acid biosynthesis glycosyltransferase
VFYRESELLAEASDPEKFYIERLIGEKIRINLEYARRASLWSDLVVIGATIARAFGWRWDILGWLRIAPPPAAL